MIIGPQIEGNIKFRNFDQVGINPNSSKNPRGPIEAYKKVWDFLGYFRVVIRALAGLRKVENTNRRNYLTSNSQKIPKKLNRPIEA